MRTRHTNLLRRWGLPVLLLAGALMLTYLAGRTWVRRGLERADYAPPPAGMVLVPAGWFLLGSDDPEAEPDEHPLRRVWLSAFYAGPVGVRRASSPVARRLRREGGAVDTARRATSPAVPCRARACTAPGRSGYVAPALHPPPPLPTFDFP